MNTGKSLLEFVGQQIMKAVRVKEFGGPNVLGVTTDVPIPKADKGQLVIKVHAAGVNPVDTYIRSGTHPVKPPLPYTPGSDASGVVEDIGENVSNFKKGDRVYLSRALSGSYGEYCTVNSFTTFMLPNQMTFSQGAAMGIPYFTAYRALVLKGQAKPGDTVLIHGASGGVGLACCQIGRSLGLTVIGTAGTAEGLHLVLNNGAHYAFNHKEAGYLEKIKDKTESQGVDMVVEMLANVNLQNDLQLLNKNGQVLVVGNRGSIEITPRLLMGKETSVKGVMLLYSTEDEWKVTGAALKSGMEQGWLKPVVDKVYYLQDAAQAHKDIIESRGAKGNLVLQL